MSNRTLPAIKKTASPPKESGTEGAIAINNGYFYIYSNGQWKRFSINKFTK